MKYSHINERERFMIYELSQKGFSITEVAHLLNRSISTISREIKRNKGQRGYRPRQAQEKARQRSKISCSNGRRVSPQAWEFAQVKLKQGWSPEKIATHLKEHGKFRISHETIYKRVYEDKRKGGTLWSHLPSNQK
ncbi:MULTISPECIES: helix-turn-helix domain-containing protein [Candidatus Ichthyocystis]|uniref:helix-turn-helix domain-containing protein n=2 Tax=Burkholderiales genera incertae sedis TaxID=224471 RepID=UPI000B2684A0|nr:MULTISPECIES: helix-turn-helix domain-containing protein [Ichthyocystis]